MRKLLLEKKMTKNKSIAPFVKWVGGKRQLLPAIQKNLPKDFKTYFEPFVGGGAVIFNLQPERAVINDSNEELVNVYRTVKNNVEALIEDLRKHKNESDYFYEIRALDRAEGYQKLSSVVRASRLLFLNKTCFNGLYRVNNSGEFNAPFGKYKNPNIVNEKTLRAVSEYLNNNDVEICCGDYDKSLKGMKKGDFVYFDPPYHPSSSSSNFTGYTKSGFGKHDQIRLKEVCDSLNAKGINFLLSNSATDFIKELYADYDISIVRATRSINSNASKRGKIDEVLVKNYE